VPTPPGKRFPTRLYMNMHWKQTRIVMAISVLLAASSCVTPRLPVPVDPGVTPPPSTPPPQSARPEHLLNRLLEGNRRFAGGSTTANPATTAASPMAVVLCCSDSAVSPERIFDCRTGELRVIRTAGPVLDKEARGQLASAVSALQVHLFVVLGHRRCETVRNAIKLAENALAKPDEVQTIPEQLYIALEMAMNDQGDFTDNATRRNVIEALFFTRKLPAIKEAGPQLTIVGAYFDDDSRLVEIVVPR
jgi:carbonic anhydrase